MIDPISAHEVVVLARQTVQLPLITQELRDEAMLAALIRRAASIFCPCSPSTIANAVFEHLQDISRDEEEELRSDIQDAIEKAIIVGDLLELNQATTDSPDVKSTWVFAASPAFVRRLNGGVILTGISGDDPNPLPGTFKERIIYDRHYRKISPEPAEDLAQVLSGFGLVELSERNWTRAPREETAREHRDRVFHLLNTQRDSGELRDLEILDPAKTPSYYRGRWVKATNQTGIFVSRRPQAYGAALWSLASLANGVAQRFLDLPYSPRMRGMDCAWHLQMAIDACNGTPQTYRKRTSGSGVCLDFFSPIPSWAERRLGIIGQTAPKERCLFTYFLPLNEAEAEEIFIKQNLWLSLREEQG